jgi:hypothetical protein
MKEIGPGQTVEYDVYPTTIPNTCGTPTTDKYLKFFNTQAVIIFEIRYRWGCAICPAAVQDGDG